jgi:ribosome-interacting GTPase 1
LDASKPLTHKFKIEYELEGFGIRLNKSPPDIKLTKRDKGGCIITKMVTLTKLDDETIRSVLKEYRLVSCDIIFKCDASIDELIDVIQGNRIYMPCLYILNKIDKLYIEELELLEQVPNYVCVNAKDKWNLDELVERIWEELDLIRVYTKPRKQVPDFTAPVILKRKYSKVEQFCTSIHKTLATDMKSAYVWGKSVKHNPQKVGKDHQLFDEDVIQVNKK